MSFCKPSYNFYLYDVTPVENLFIREFLPTAPGDFVKVYLYGLSHCYNITDGENNVAEIAKSLHMDKQIIENAYRFWERQGVLKISNEGNTMLSIEYFNLKEAFFNRDHNAQETLYQYKDFNQNLQLIFGSRLIQAPEYTKIHDWIEIFDLPREVVLMMVQHYVTQKGTSININYLDKIAKSWAQQGIKTLESAEEHLVSREATFTQTKKTLEFLGIKRRPTQMELEIYRKWTGEWNFTLDAIKEASREMVKIQNPNMGYLDKILERLYNLNAVTAKNIQNMTKERETSQSIIREIINQLGIKGTGVTDEHRSLYNTWADEWKMDDKVIIVACRQLVRSHSGNFERLNSLLQSWHKRNISSLEDLKIYQLKLQHLDEQVRSVLSALNENRPSNASERKLMMHWTNEWGFGMDIILKAAEYSINKTNGPLYINRILEEWHKRGINDTVAAEEDHRRHIEAISIVKGKKDKKDFRDFSQHTYTEEEIESLYEEV